MVWTRYWRPFRSFSFAASNLGALEPSPSKTYYTDDVRQKIWILADTKGVRHFGQKISNNNTWGNVLKTYLLSFYSQWCRCNDCLSPVAVATESTSIFTSFVWKYIDLTMKTVATLLAVVGSAAAFAPAQQSRSSTSLAAKPFADALGAQAPVSL